MVRPAITPRNINHSFMLPSQMPPPHPDCRRRDAWTAHEPYSTVWVVFSAMAVVMQAMELEGLIDPPNSLACVVEGPGCAHDWGLCMRDSSWRSLHPCTHWLCGACADNWFMVQKKNTCPLCRTPVLFMSEYLASEY